MAVFCLLMFNRWFDQPAVGFFDSAGKPAIQSVAAADLDGWWGFCLLLGLMVVGAIVWFVTYVTDNQTVDWICLILFFVSGIVVGVVLRDKLHDIHTHTASLWCGLAAAGALFIFLVGVCYNLAEQVCRAYNIVDREGHQRD